MRSDKPHQAKVLAWAMPRPHVAFFLAMRLGKTHIAIRWAEARTKGIKLVVAPIGTLLSWGEELEADGLKYVTLLGASQKKLQQLDDRPKDVKWILVNPEGLRACPEILAGLPVSCVILDESPFIANPKARITRIVHLRLGNVPNRAILTGTPDPEGLHQYYEQMRFIEGLTWMGKPSFWSWRLRYFHKSWYDWVPHATTEHLIEKAVAKDAYVMDSKSVFGHKPIYQVRTVDMQEKVKTLYRKAYKEMALGDAETKWTPVVQTWLAQIAGGSIPKDYDCQGELFFASHKMDELKRILFGELKRKQIVVYFRFNRELLQAYRVLQDCAMIRGSTPMAERKRRIDSFRKGQTRILLMQAKCARFALPLWMASAAIFYSNYWDAMTRQQLEARLHGENRKDQPLYIDLVTNGTLDGKVVKALKEKKRNSKSFLQRVRELHNAAGD